MKPLFSFACFVSAFLRVGLLCLAACFGPVWAGPDWRAEGPDDFMVEWVEIDHSMVIEVNSLLQTREGMVWVGTKSGVYLHNRYGNGFPQLENTPGDYQSLTSNLVTALFQDADGRIWVGTEEGLNVTANFSRTKFERFTAKEDVAGSLSGNGIGAINQAPDGRILVGTLGQGFNILEQVDFSTKFRVFRHDKADSDSLPSDWVFDIAVNEERVWVATARGLAEFLPQEMRFERYINPIPFSRSQRISKIYPEGSFLWVIQDNHLLRFNTQTGEFQQPQEIAGIQNQFGGVFSMAMGQETMWLGTEKAVVHIDRRSGEYFPLQSRDQPLAKSQAMMLDRGGVLWLDGMIKLANVKPAFKNFKHFSPGNKLDENYVISMFGDEEQRLWVISKAGLSYLDKDSEQLKRAKLLVEEENPKLFSGTVDSKGRIWIGMEKQVMVWDPFKDDLQVYPWQPEKKGSLPIYFVTTMTADFHGGVYLGDADKGKGLAYFNPKTEAFELFEHKKHDPATISDGRISKIMVDSKGMVWVGTYQGLNVFDPETKRFVRFQNSPKHPYSLSHNTVYAIHETRDNEIWVGTISGLNRMIRSKGKFKVYYTDQGLPDNTIYGIADDAEGHLWLSTKKGLTRYNPETGSAINFNLKDGLENKFAPASYYQDKKGTVYFGGVNGFNSFHPEKVRYNETKPLLYIPEIVNSYGETPDLPMMEISGISVPHGKNFWVRVVSSDYFDPSKNMLSYKIPGLMDEWARPQQKTYIEPEALAPGNHELLIRVSNSSGMWSDIHTLKVEIVPPFYWSNAAKGFYLIAIPLLIFGLHRLRVRKMKAREEELTRIVEERTRSLREEKEKTEAQAKKLVELDRLKTQFFSNVSHEFRTPLTLIIGPLESLVGGAIEYTREKLDHQHEVMLRNARRLLRLINQLLDISKLEAGKMELRTAKASLLQFVKSITYAFSSLADKKGIVLKVVCEEEDVQAFFDKEKIEKVMFNLLSNAFQFTQEGGSIRVTLSKNVDQQGRESAMLAVADTGTGIPAADLPHLFDRFHQVDGSATRKHEGTGIGLSLVKELVTLHRGNINVDSTLGEGTCFTVSLPLGSDHLAPHEIRAEGVSPEFEVSEGAALELANLGNGRVKKAAKDLDSCGATILVVDDHPDIRQYVRSAFADKYRILEAANGKEGLEMVRDHHPDLVISDVMMPVMDGYAFCRALKRDRKTNHIPVILLTAKASDDMRVEGLEIGADDYLSKPFNVRELMARIKNQLAIRGQERAMRESLSMASRAQISMLPKDVPRMEGLDIATFSQPAREVGGDYYDFVTQPDGRLGVVVGDVSGKGLPAALYMTMAKGLVQASASNTSPKGTLADINRQFRHASAPNIFMSLIYALIDPQSGKMVFSDAGHLPILLRRADGRLETLKSRGIAIGLGDSEVFDKVMQDIEVDLNEGDMLVMYTDGLNEGMNESDEVFGDERLIELVERGKGLSANAMLELIRSEYAQFVGNTEQFDDLTAVVIRYTGTQSKAAVA